VVGIGKGKKIKNSPAEAERGVVRVRHQLGGGVLTCKSGFGQSTGKKTGGISHLRVKRMGKLKKKTWVEGM